MAKICQSSTKVSVKYLYDKEKLLKLGENFYRATKRASVLHNKIFPKPDIASGMDQYIYEQVDKGNYVEINPSEACLNHQLHFVGYNFVVSSTSFSSKVRMTTDSSTHTESGLSLKGVTKPAPGVVPSLQGILLRSGCHVYFSVFDIKKFFRSVRIESVRIDSVSLPSFSAKPSPNTSWIFYWDCSIPFGDSA